MMPQQLTSQQLNETALIFKLLSHPVRIHLLYLLAQQPLNVTEIADLLQLEQSAVSHQLAHLRQHQVIASRQQGKNRQYYLDDPHILEILTDALGHADHVLRHQQHGH